MNINEYADQDMMMIELATLVADELGSALARKDRVTFAVPGGTTPGPLFDDLCATDLDWARVDILLTDERWVPEDNPRSNTRLLRERLLSNYASQANLLPLFSNDKEPDEALPDLRKAIGPHLPIDIAIFGMGADMHTASLFPGADNLAPALDTHAPILLPMRAPGAPELRVSLTMPVLDGSLSKHLLITGQEKRDALMQAKKINDPMVAPISGVMRDLSVHWAP